ncbi:MFS transporter [Liquorilactobacillus sicerae]|uniref:MFS transporter n=1 Tax=Liquorilactobacillus sicerae TaxID=1416943 RepID=UPI00248066B2|nr:MFS transporter [Liquorilactobacillus sicerae]
MSEIAISDRQSNVQIFKDFSSNLIGSLSGEMFSFGMGLMLLNQTHLAISFGISTIIGPFVSLLLLVPLGNIVDCYPHRVILIISDLLRLISLLLFAWTLPLFAGTGKLIPVVIFSMLDYIWTDFSSTAYSAAVHELVNERKIQKLSSLTSTASSISSIFSPLLGVALYSLVGFETFIVIEVLSSLVSFLIMLTMNFHYAPKTTKKQSTQAGQLQMFKAGIGYIRHRPLIKGVIMIGVLINFIFTSLTVGMPFVINDTLHLGNLPISILESADSVGVLLGSLAMSWQPTKNYVRQLLVIPLIMDGLIMMLLGLVLMFFRSAASVSIAGAFVMFLLGVAIVIPNIVMQVELQKSVPTEFLGRVTTTLITINSLIMPLGTLFYTYLFQNIHANYWIFIVNGLFSTIYILALLPKINRFLDQEKYQQN